MTSIKTRIAAAALASCAVFNAQVALAQEKCVERQDLADAMVYTVPIAYSAFTRKCAAELTNDGFVATEGEQFVSRYAALQNERWEGAFGFLKTFMNKGDEKDEIAMMISAMPPEALRPFVDALVEMEIAKEIKISDCRKLERLIAPLAPLPPDNFGEFVATVFELMPERPSPKLCRNDN